jgi:dTMP kinase
MVEQGIWVAVEGIDGAGKTSAIQTIQQVFKDFKMKTHVYREPGGTALGERIRSILKSDDLNMLPISEVLLLYAARVQLLEENLFPALKSGVHVILDRHELSTFAYQAGGRGIDINVIRQVSDSCMPHRKPDLTFFLAVKPELALKRVKERGNLDHYEQQPLEFYQKIALSYEIYISEYPNVVCIDANQTYEQVQMDIRAELENFFAAKFA